jgi:hypothetical protein
MKKTKTATVQYKKIYLTLLSLFCFWTITAAAGYSFPQEVTHIQEREESPPMTVEVQGHPPILHIVFPETKHIIKHVPMLDAQIYPGSLKENVTRIANFYGWPEVIWDAADDYCWVGTADLSARDLESLLEKLLEDYPLQAIFYQGNHVLVIVPRTTQ